MITIPHFQKLSKTHRISISIAGVLIITGSVFALHATQQPAIVSANTTTTHHSTQKPTTAATSTSAGSASTSTTAGTSSSTSSKTTSKTSSSTSAITYSASNPNNSTALPVATVVPITPGSSYTPTPSFSLSLHADQGYATTYPTIPNYAYYNIPYSLSYDPGFTLITTAGPSCNFVSGPSLANIWCNVGEKSSELSIQYDNDTMAGHYVVQMSYIMNGTTHTDAVSFDVQ